MPEPAKPLQLCILASGSAGNCSVLTYGSGLTTRAFLIDAGLSPRRTRTLLADLGLRFDQLDHILVTHFDRDHFHLGWQAAGLDRVELAEVLSGAQQRWAVNEIIAQRVDSLRVLPRSA